MAFVQRVVSRLAFRIYLLGVAQVLVLFCGVVALRFVFLPAEIPSPLRLAGYVGSHVADALADPAALQREVDYGRSVIATSDVFDESGKAVLTSSPADSPRCWEKPPGDGAITQMGNVFCFARRATLADGRAGYVVTKVPGWAFARMIPCAVLLLLVVVAASTLLLSRSLSAPLRRMTTTARALGSGQLDARVRLRRGDELGEVASAVDDMADRIASLLRAERELLANVSHELRTPLARIRVALDLAGEGDALVARDSLEDIAGDLEELEQLIGNVLVAARLDLAAGSAVPPLHRERLEVRDLVERSAGRFRAAHPERSLVVDVVPAGIAVDGDLVLLRRAIDNLLENANKYTEREDAEVELRVDAAAQVRIRVVDHGAGISPGDLTKLFQPFFRVDRSRTRTTGGLGLGLLLVRRIVEAHGGTVHIDSETGRGTTATILLPAIA